MAEQENIQVAEKFFALINAHDFSQSGLFQTADYRQESPGAPGTMNSDQATAYLRGFVNAFPDLHFELKHKIAQGDFVVVNWLATGTHTGGLLTPTGATLPPTGKKAVVPGSTTYQFRDGLAARSWVHWDMVTLLAQLGLMPGM